MMALMVLAPSANLSLAMLSVFVVMPFLLVASLPKSRSRVMQWTSWMAAGVLAGGPLIIVPSCCASWCWLDPICWW